MGPLLSLSFKLGGVTPICRSCDEPGSRTPGASPTLAIDNHHCCRISQKPGPRGVNAGRGLAARLAEGITLSAAIGEEVVAAAGVSGIGHALVLPMAWGRG